MNVRRLLRNFFIALKAGDVSFSSPYQTIEKKPNYENLCSVLSEMSLKTFKVSSDPWYVLYILAEFFET